MLKLTKIICLTLAFQLIALPLARAQSDENASQSSENSMTPAQLNSQVEKLKERANVATDILGHSGWVIRDSKGKEIKVADLLNLDSYTNVDEITAVAPNADDLQLKFVRVLGDSKVSLNVTAKALDGKVFARRSIEVMPRNTDPAQLVVQFQQTMQSLADQVSFEKKRDVGFLEKLREKLVSIFWIKSAHADVTGYVHFLATMGVYIGATMMAGGILVTAALLIREGSIDLPRAGQAAFFAVIAGGVVAFLSGIIMKVSGELEPPRLGSNS